MQFGLQGLPIDAAGLGLQLDAKPLQRLIEFTNGFLFVDALIALEALDTLLQPRQPHMRVASCRCPPALPTRPACAVWRPEKPLLLLSNRQCSQWREGLHQAEPAMKTLVTPKLETVLRP